MKSLAFVFCCVTGEKEKNFIKHSRVYFSKSQKSFQIQVLEGENNNKKLKANQKQFGCAEDCRGDRYCTWEGATFVFHNLILCQNACFFFLQMRNSFQIGISFILLELKCLVLSLTSTMGFLKLSQICNAKSTFTYLPVVDRNSKSECYDQNVYPPK